MSKIKNGGLDQYGSEPFKQQQFGTAGIDGVNTSRNVVSQWLLVISRDATNTLNIVCRVTVWNTMPHSIKFPHLHIMVKTTSTQRYGQATVIDWTAPPATITNLTADNGRR